MKHEAQKLLQVDRSNYKVLLYNPFMDFDDRLLNKFTLADSPAACLQKATENNYDIIVIFHQFRSEKERFALVELCSILKKNPYTRHIPLMCLLPSKHRKLLDQLQNAGVEYVRYYGQNDPAPEYIESLLSQSFEDCRIERTLAEMCPYINYHPISRHQEILYCGAYRNRLVLGPHRLCHSCETTSHKNCQYFKCPKFF